METSLPPDYLVRIRNRQKGYERNLPSFLHDKIKGEAFVRSLGAPTSRQIRSFTSADSIDLDGLPERFVLKPTFMSSSFGVMVLERRGENYYDFLRKRDLTLEAIIEEQQRHSDSTKRETKDWIVEEVATDAEGADVPDDYKFFCFQGRVGLVHRTIRGTPRNRHAFFEGDFTPMADNDESQIWTNPAIVDRIVVSPPSTWRTFLNLARRISTAVPSPFVRIDMYNTTRGPVFGEFTLVPGTFFYEDREKMSPVLSTKLGKLWAEAEGDLE